MSRLCAISHFDIRKGKTVCFCPKSEKNQKRSNMASKADYLKKYLEPDKKRKKRKVKSKGNLTVKDTDVDWDEIKPDDDAEFAPTIACVVDDRPDALRRKQGD